MAKRQNREQHNYEFKSYINQGPVTMFGKYESISRSILSDAYSRFPPNALLKNSMGPEFPIIEMHYAKKR